MFWSSDPLYQSYCWVHYVIQLNYLIPFLFTVQNHLQPFRKFVVLRWELNG